ncbi:MAG: tol-pal system protein YbgF [Thermodesulfobacteriota bacterium]|nr:MAG: tol-pal system protein YbgF [Thermodesulfobacteriota bacterium]
MQSVKDLKDLVFSKKNESFFLKAMRLVFVAFLPMLLVHCAPQDQANMLERRVSSLSAENRAYSNQINSLKQEIADLAKSQDIASVRSRQAELANRMDELQAELLRMNGLIDQIGHKNEQEEEETVRFREDLKKQVENMREEVKLLQASTKVTKEVEQAREKAALGAVDLYQQALDLIKQKKYKDAKKTLMTYIEKHPHGKRVANAYFWMGECEYNLQRFEEAILEYQKVISRYPKSNKVPDALLKQGIAFARLGDNESAKIVLNKLIKKYPKSPQMSVAKKKLAKIK